MRYSLNVLTASGAQLAEMLETQNVIDPDGTWLEPRSAAAQTLFPLEMFRKPEAQAEELADLTGVIRDWFGDVEHRIPFDRHTMLLFGGLGYDDRFTQPALPSSIPGTIDAFGDLVEDSETGPTIPGRTTARPAPDLPPAVMLAAIKAATMTALEHSATRQFEIARDLAAHRLQLETMGERVQAWRMMLTLVLNDDPDTLRLLDDQVGADPLEMLSACATVALTAYQKKKDALARTRAR